MWAAARAPPPPPCPSVRWGGLGAWGPGCGCALGAGMWLRWQAGRPVHMGLAAAARSSVPPCRSPWAPPARPRCRPGRRHVCGGPAEALTCHQPSRAAVHAAGGQPCAAARAAAVGCAPRAGRAGTGRGLRVAALACACLRCSPVSAKAQTPADAAITPTNLQITPPPPPPPPPPHTHTSQRGGLHLCARRGCRQRHHHIPVAVCGPAAHLAAARRHLQNLPRLRARPG